MEYDLYSFEKAYCTSEANIVNQLYLNRKRKRLQFDIWHCINKKGNSILTWGNLSHVEKEAGSIYKSRDFGQNVSHLYLDLFVSKETVKPDNNSLFAHFPAWAFLSRTSPKLPWTPLFPQAYHWPPFFLYLAGSSISFLEINSYKRL